MICLGDPLDLGGAAGAQRVWRISWGAEGGDAGARLDVPGAAVPRRGAGDAASRPGAPRPLAGCVPGTGPASTEGAGAAGGAGGRECAGAADAPAEGSSPPGAAVTPAPGTPEASDGGGAATADVMLTAEVGSAPAAAGAAGSFGDAAPFEAASAALDGRASLAVVRSLEGFATSAVTGAIDGPAGVRLAFVGVQRRPVGTRGWMIFGVTSNGGRKP